MLLVYNEEGRLETRTIPSYGDISPRTSSIQTVPSYCVSITIAWDRLYKLYFYLPLNYMYSNRYSVTLFSAKDRMNGFVLPVLFCKRRLPRCFSWWVPKSNIRRARQIRVLRNKSVFNPYSGFKIRIEDFTCFHFVDFWIYFGDSKSSPMTVNDFR